MRVKNEISQANQVVVEEADAELISHVKGVVKWQVEGSKLPNQDNHSNRLEVQREDLEELEVGQKHDCQAQDKTSEHLANGKSKGHLAASLDIQIFEYDSELLLELVVALINVVDVAGKVYAHEDGQADQGCS